jgi:formylglycine-generating enzyme required for sulfatase activity
VEAGKRGKGEEGKKVATKPPPAVAPFDAKQARKHQEDWAKHLGVPIEWQNSIGMKFVLIPPGEFDMGSTQEEVDRLLAEAKQRSEPQWYIGFLPSQAPRHRVRITRPFYLGKHEVTQAQYEGVMQANPSHFKDSGPDTPVETVSWDDAVAFCRWLSELPEEKKAACAYRLPTEAEWEYACRAGTTTAWSFGDDEALLSDHAWRSQNSGGFTNPVGQKRPNAWGLYDMHGNVLEWCHDWWAAGYCAESPAEDPVGPDSGAFRVLRGGSWKCEYCGLFRCTFRYLNPPNHRYHGNGFRVARTLPP